MVGGGGRAFGVRGKLHPISLGLNISHRFTGWTLKARNSGFFYLGGRNADNFGKGTSSGFPHRESARLPNGITDDRTLTDTGLGGLERYLRHGGGPQK